jgi:Ca2+/Na+ antiporter
MSLYAEPDNVNNLSAAVTNVNTNAHGSLSIGWPVTVFIIIMIVGLTKNWKLSRTFTAAFFSYTILAFFFAIGKFLNHIFWIAGVLFTALCAMWMWADRD